MREAVEASYRPRVSEVYGVHVPLAERAARLQCLAVLRLVAGGEDKEAFGGGSGSGGELGWRLAGRRSRSREFSSVGFLLLSVRYIKFCFARFERQGEARFSPSDETDAFRRTSPGNPFSLTSHGGGGMPQSGLLACIFMHTVVTLRGRVLPWSIASWT